MFSIFFSFLASGSTSRKTKTEAIDRFHGRTGSRHSNDTVMSSSALSSLSSSYGFKGRSTCRRASPPSPPPYTATPLLYLLEKGDLLDPDISAFDGEDSSNLLDEFSRKEVNEGKCIYTGLVIPTIAGFASLKVK